MTTGPHDRLTSGFTVATTICRESSHHAVEVLTFALQTLELLPGSSVGPILYQISNNRRANARQDVNFDRAGKEQWFGCVCKDEKAPGVIRPGGLTYHAGVDKN